MAKNDDIIRENDGPDGDDRGTTQQPNQQREDVGIANTELRPITDPPIRRGREPDAPREEYDIVETDDSGNPVGGEQPGETDNRQSDEGRLSERDAGERTYLETQRAEEDQGRRRRETSQERRERKKQARERDRNENTHLRQSLDEVRRELDEFRNGTAQRLTQFDQGRVNGEMSRIASEIEKHDAIIAQAEAAGKAAMRDTDGDAFYAANKQREASVLAKFQLERAAKDLKQQVETAARAGADPGDGTRQTQQDQQRPQPTAQRQVQLTSDGRRHRDEFMSEFSWFNRNARDAETRRDSNRLAFLDDEVAREGYNPNSQEYWDELRERMQEVLPHVFDDDDDAPPARNGRDNDRRPKNGSERRMNGNGNGAERKANGNGQPPPRRGPPVADTNGARQANPNRTTVKITPERKRALIQTGSLGEDGRVLNEDKFKRQLKNFADYDAQNAAGR